MKSNLIQQRESDPLFAAAEVVQDSADRMESIFHLLLHEQSLVQGYHPESRLLHSIQYHKRDLATSLETAKWQLEDFEREVNMLAMADKSVVRENVISRHKQFIGAIREQIVNVEKSFERTSVGDSVRNMEWVGLNEKDRDGLASFLSGEKPAKYVGREDSENDSRALRNFLDPDASSSIIDEIVEQKTETMNMNGVTDLGPNVLRENKFSDLQVASSGRCEENDWDLEANEAKDKTSWKQNMTWGYYSRIGMRSLRDFVCAFWGRGNRSFTKRWKDGEEQRHSPRGLDISHTMQSSLSQLWLACRCRNFEYSVPDLYARLESSCYWLRDWVERLLRSPYSITVRYPSIAFVSALLLTLIVLGTLASQVL
ncbi:hypothetical protein ACH5RR_005613 [Cinchona calisaya]|uniref:Syntaxin 6/10/61 N-terminal domain-containing protein n=1 Tax=Cinchona calisaya TaxID=153742 RepID=A0ABD3ALR4_9GENT